MSVSSNLGFGLDVYRASESTSAFGKERASMRDENKEITISGEDLIKVLKDIEVMLCSFDKIFGYYTYVDKNEDSFKSELSRFVVEWNVLRRLANVRYLLSKNFNQELGPDDLDDFERAMMNLQYRKMPGDSPREKIQSPPS